MFSILKIRKVRLSRQAPYQWHDACICGVPDLAARVACAGHPGWSIWGMDSEAFLQDWKERPERVHIVAPMPTTTHALSSNMLYQPQPQGEPSSGFECICSLALFDSGERMPFTCSHALPAASHCESTSTALLDFLSTGDM